MPIGRVLLEPIERNTSEPREMFWGGPLTQTTVVFAQGAVEHPMQGMLNRPVAPDTLRQLRRVPAKAAHRVAAHSGHGVTLSPLRLNHGHGLQPHPVLRSPQPRHIMGHRRAAPLLTPVACGTRLIGHVHPGLNTVAQQPTQRAGRRPRATVPDGP